MFSVLVVSEKLSTVVEVVDGTGRLPGMRGRIELSRVGLRVLVWLGSA